MLLISNPVYEITRMVMAIAVREAPLEYQCHFGTGMLMLRDTAARRDSIQCELVITVAGR